MSQKKKSKVDEFSYSLGAVIARSISSQGMDANDIDIKDFTKGLEDMLKGKDMKIDLAKADSIVQATVQQKMKEKEEAMIAEQKEFFEKNGKKSGITTTASGIQYEIMKEGNGPIPTANDRVTTHYHGMLLDGTVFDSSVERGQPATFPVGGVIQGWQEILQLMPVGSKWKVYIPSELGYGSRGAGQSIPPNAALIFEIELIEIAK